MPSLNSLERKFGRFAIPYLIPAIAGLQLLNFFLLKGNPNFFNALLFIPSKILSGEIWRLFTWILIPDGGHLIWMIIGTIFTIWIGRTLEEEWGAFKTTAFVVLTVVAVAVIGIAMALIYPPLRIIPPPMLNLYFGGALLATFAFLFPEKEILLFLVIPVKIKWIGFFVGGWAIYTMIKSPIFAPHILATWAGFLVFVVPEAVQNIKQGKSAAARRKKFEQASTVSSGTAFHTCAICNTTDVASPDTEFRISSEGEEYCVPCLEKKTST